MKALLIALLLLVGTACSTKEVKPSNANTDSEAAILDLAAQLSSTIGWLKALERGDTNELRTVMRSRLTVNAMLLDKYLIENPGSTNTVLASNILQKVYSTLGSTNKIGSWKDIIDQLPNWTKENADAQSPSEKKQLNGQREVIKIPMH